MSLSSNGCIGFLTCKEDVYGWYKKHGLKLKITHFSDDSLVTVEKSSRRVI